MDLFIETIFELIFEGTVELTRSKKVPMLIRILATIIVSSLLLGLEALFIIIALNAWRDSNPAGCVAMGLFAIAGIILIIYKTVKEYRRIKLNK